MQNQAYTVLYITGIDERWITYFECAPNILPIKPILRFSLNSFSRDTSESVRAETFNYSKCLRLPAQKQTNERRKKKKKPITIKLHTNLKLDRVDGCKGPRGGPCRRHCTEIKKINKKKEGIPFVTVIVVALSPPKNSELSEKKKYGKEGRRKY